MIQVIRINRITGKFDFLDADGKKVVLDSEWEGLEREEADVLLERFRQGYQHGASGCYIARIECDSTASHLKLTNFLTFDLDDDGFSFAKELPLVDAATYALPWTEHDKFETTVAFLDYEAYTFKWLANPLGETPFTNNFAEASKCCEVDEDVNEILTASVRYALRDQPAWVVEVFVRYRK